MMQASLESLGASVFVLMIFDVCCRIAYRMLWVVVTGVSEFEMHVAHRVCLLARRSRPYVAMMLKVGRVVVKEYGQVLSWEGITWVVMVMGSSSYSGWTGYVEFSWTCMASRPSGDMWSLANCMWVS